MAFPPHWSAEYHGQRAHNLPHTKYTFRSWFPFVLLPRWLWHILYKCSVQNTMPRGRKVELGIIKDQS